MAVVWNDVVGWRGWTRGVRRGDRGALGRVTGGWVNCATTCLHDLVRKMRRARLDLRARPMSVLYAHGAVVGRADSILSLLRNERA